MLILGSNRQDKIMLSLGPRDGLHGILVNFILFTVTVIPLPIDLLEWTPITSPL